MSCGAATHADVVSSEDLEDIEQMRDTEKLPNRFADVDQLQIALKAVIARLLLREWSSILLRRKRCHSKTEVRAFGTELPETNEMTMSDSSDFSAEMRPLYIPVILGTVRNGRMSEHPARLMSAELAKRTNVETEFIDIAHLPLPTDDAGQNIKDPEFASKMARADGLVIVSPEYNHGYSGLLKHVLDSCLSEYIHKAVGIAGVSAGTFGGTRGIQDLLPVMRELGLVTIFWDVNFANVHKLFAADGVLRDGTMLPRIDQFLKELIWMAKTLRHGREHINLE